MNKQVYNMLSPGVNCAYPEPQVVKRAAMLFDYIYAPSWKHGYENVPSSLRVEVPVSNEKMDIVAKKLRNELKENYLQTTSTEGKKKSQLSKRELGSLVDEITKFIDEFLMRIFVDSFRIDGYHVTPVYQTQRRFFLDHPSRSALAYQAALENLPEIIEDQVSWEQIIEFRSDKEALRKYRKLRLWLEYSLSAQSLDHARDLIAKKIEDYEWAIRKHGLKTATGALSQIFSWQGLISVAAGAGVGAAMGGPIWSALSGSLLTIGKASVWIANRMIDKQDLLRGTNSETALIYEARRLVREEK